MQRESKIYDEFDILSKTAEKATGLRIEELLSLNDEVRSKDLVFQEYNRQIQAKKEELLKKKEEMEIAEKNYEENYQNLVYSPELDNMQNFDSFDENQEMSKNIMNKINNLRDEINEKLKLLNFKEKKMEEREKKFLSEYEFLSKEEKDVFKQLHESLLKEQKCEINSNGAEDQLNLIKDLNFENILLEITTSIKNLSRRRLSSSMDDILANNKKRDVAQLKQNKDFYYKNDILRQSHNQTINDNLASIENISHIHETEMINNKEMLLTEGINYNFTPRLRDLSFNEIIEEERDNTRNLNKRKNKRTKSMVNPKIIKTDASISSFSKVKLNHNESYSNFLNSGLILEGVNLNRTFYLIRQKRMQQMLNSSIEAQSRDKSGSLKFRKNDDNLQRQASLRSSIERSASLSPNSSDPKLKLKDRMKESINIDNNSVIIEENTHNNKNNQLSKQISVVYKPISTTNSKFKHNESLKTLTTENNRIDSKPQNNNYNITTTSSNRYAHIQPRYNKNFLNFLEKPNEKLNRSERKNARANSTLSGEYTVYKNKNSSIDRSKNKQTDASYGGCVNTSRITTSSNAIKGTPVKTNVNNNGNVYTPTKIKNTELILKKKISTRPGDIISGRSCTSGTIILKTQK